MNKQFVISNTLKRNLIIALIVGIVLLTVGVILNLSEPTRIWANVLLNGFYFLAIALGAAFFVAVHSLGEAGWHTVIQRVPESMARYLPIGSLMFLIIIPGIHDLYHWSHSEHLDTILQGKSSYLNLPFFLIRTAIYLIGWNLLVWKLRQTSLKMDDASGDALMWFKKMRNISGVFIVFLAITSSTSSWDWIMSIDAHWFSTLFGWYTFSSIFVSAIASITAIVVVLIKLGYLEFVNEEHLHDLGKYLFGFSIFWAYLWVSQYLLIWYSNIPEETTYYVTRQNGFETLFFVNVFINFLLPILLLMSRGAKRNVNMLLLVSVIVIVGHWLDLYLAIIPGSVGVDHHGIGILEVGMFLLYGSIFLLVTFNGLTKGALFPERHPYFKESFDYENIS